MQVCVYVNNFLVVCGSWQWVETLTRTSEKHENIMIQMRCLLSRKGVGNLATGSTLRYAFFLVESGLPHTVPQTHAHINKSFFESFRLPQLRNLISSHTWNVQYRPPNADTHSHCMRNFFCEKNLKPPTSLLSNVQQSSKLKLLWLVHNALLGAVRKTASPWERRQTPKTIDCRTEPRACLKESTSECMCTT